MYRLLTPIVLCCAAQMAGAQCVNATTTAAAPETTHMRPAVELITSAAAGTRDGVVLTQSASTRKGHGGDEPRHPTGRAMLLAAVALMSGIALRRASASGQ